MIRQKSITSPDGVEGIHGIKNPLSVQKRLMHEWPSALSPLLAGSTLGVLATDTVRTLNALGAVVFLGPAATLITAISALGAHVLISRRDKKRALDAAQLQQEVRDQAGIPIDIISVKNEKNNNSHRVVLRSYVADSPGVSSQQALVGLRKTYEFAIKNEIKHVVIGADYPRDILNGAGTDGKDVRANNDSFAALKPYGKVVDGQTYTSGVVGAENPIRDLASAENVLVMSRSKFGKLLEELEHRADEPLVSRLIDITGDKYLKEQYGSFSKDEKGNYSIFLQSLRNRLERHINSDGPEAHVERTAEGYPIRGRAQPSSSISGGNVQTFTVTSTDSSTARFASQSLLSKYGASSVEELVDRALHKMSDLQNSAEMALVAAYLLTLDQATDVQSLSTGISSPGSHLDNPIKTFFERLPTMNSPDSKIIQERSRLSKAATTALAVAMGFGVSLGFGVLNDAAKAGSDRQISAALEDTVYSSFTTWISDPSTLDDRLGKTPGEMIAAFEQKRLEEYSKKNPIQAAVLEAVYAQDSIRNDVKDRTARAYEDIFGPEFTSSISSSADLRLIDQWLSKVSRRDALSGSPTSVFPDSHVRDEGDIVNKTVYEITSLDGTSTEGYWYTGNYGNMRAYNGGVVFREEPQYPSNHIRFLEQNLIPGDEMTIDELNDVASLVVTTPYVEFQKPLELPILKNTEIAGVRLIDRDDPTKAYTLRVFDTKNSDNPVDLPRIYISPNQAQEIWRNGTRNVELRYWLKSSEGKVVDAYGKGLSLSRDDQPMPQSDLEQIARRTIAALGLPEDATPEDVAQAIREKKYSFTPLADSGKDKLFNAGPHELYAEQLAMAGEGLAGLDSVKCDLASAAFVLSEADQGGRYGLVSGYMNVGNNSL